MKYMEENKIDATENANSTDSSTKTNETDTTHSSEGVNTQTEKTVPWHEDPRWKAWQTEKEELYKFKQEAEPLMKQFKPKEEVNIPSWFGGDEAQWKAFQEDQSKLVEQAEKRAIDRIKSEKADEEKRVKDANDYFEQSVAEIEKTGDKVDKNKLLKFVMDNELIDSQGRWAYKTAYKFMKASEPKEDDSSLEGRKKLAESTTSESKAEQKPKNYKTSEDFKGKSWNNL